MVGRYILAFVLSVALLFAWNAWFAPKRPQPPDIEKVDGKAEKKKAEKDKTADEKTDPGDIGAAKPGKKAEVEKPAGVKPAAEPAPPGFSPEWKDGVLRRVLKDGEEYASFGPTGGWLDLGIQENGGWEKIGSDWKAVEGEGGSGWTHEAQRGELKITRRVSASVAGDGILRLNVNLEFENKGPEARYHLGAGSGRADGFVAASWVEGQGAANVESRSLDGDQIEPWRRAGETKWVALRRGKKLAVLFPKEMAGEAALVNADGVFLEGKSLEAGASKHSYELAIGGNDPRLLEKYRVEGDLSLINRSEIDLSDEIRVELDSGRGTLSKVWLRKHFTAVKDKDGLQEIQPILVDPDSGSALLGMGPIDDSQSDSSKDWGGSWSETVRELASGGREIIFEKRIGSVRIRKKISPAAVSKDGSGEFDKLLQIKAGALGGSNLLRVSIELTNLAEEREKFPFMLYGPGGMLSSAASSRFAGEDIELVVGHTESSSIKATEPYQPNGELEEAASSIENKKQVVWVAAVNAYFTALMFPSTRSEEQRIRAEEMDYPADGWWPIQNEAHREGQKSVRAAFKCGQGLFLPPGGNSRELTFGLYVGPRVSDFIESGSALEFEGANDFGITNSLIHFFIAFLNLLQQITFGNWGLAIILLTVIVKLCLHPITRKNQRGMMRMGKAMAKIKPEMEVLQAQYGEDRMKYSAEVQKLWKRHDVNPAKQMLGCLVIFLQMPIWIGIIWSLEYVIGVRQESFLYILDLTKPDRLLYSLWWFELGPNDTFYFWPFYGQLNLLPILYVILSVVNFKMQPRSEDPQAATQQKMMGYMMVVFGLIFYTFASGFMLYIMTSMALGIAESKIIKAQLAREDLEEEGQAGGEAAVAAAGPLYTTKKKSAGKSVVPSSAKKKKRRKRR